MKCPKCRASLEAGTAVCEYCGHEFNDTEANKLIVSFVEKFESIEADVDALGLGLSRRKEEIKFRRASAIRDFPIPNSREDLLQLLYYIQPKCMDSAAPDSNQLDWRTKYQEVMSRARLAYKDDAERLYELKQMEMAINTTVADGLKNSAKRNPLFFIIAVIAVVAIAGVLGKFYVASKQQADCEDSFAKQSQMENERLNALYSTVQDLIGKSQFDRAHTELPKLYWGVALACQQSLQGERKTTWQGKHDELAGLIAQQEQKFKQQAQDEDNRQREAKAAEDVRLAAEAQVQRGKEKAAEDKVEHAKAAKAAVEKAVEEKSIRDNKKKSAEQLF